MSEFRTQPMTEAVLTQQLLGRAQWLRDQGGVKSPDLMEKAVARIQELENLVERLRARAQQRADFWYEQAEKAEGLRGEHYEVLGSQFQHIANEAALQKDTAK